MDSIPLISVGDPIFLIPMYVLDIKLYGHVKVLLRSWLLVEICVYLSRKSPPEIKEIT